MTNEIATERLQSLIERIENLISTRDDINEDIKNVLSESRSAGFNVKAIREIIKMRKQDASQREELEHYVELYKKAVDL